MKIAIVKTREIYRSDPYGDDGFYENIVHHITDWEEVTNEEYELLRRGLAMQGGEFKYTIIEYVEKPRTVINTTVKEYQKWVKKQEEDRAQCLAEEARKKEERKQKRLVKDKIKKEEQLKKLAQELGVEVEVKKL